MASSKSSDFNEKNYYHSKAQQPHTPETISIGRRCVLDSLSFGEFLLLVIRGRSVLAVFNERRRRSNHACHRYEGLPLPGDSCRFNGLPVPAGVLDDSVTGFVLYSKFRPSTISYYESDSEN